MSVSRKPAIGNMDPKVVRLRSKTLGATLGLFCLLFLVRGTQCIRLKRCREVTEDDPICSDDLDYSAASPPAPPQGGPTQVSSSLEVLNVYDIDEAKYKFTIALHMNLAWQDRRIESPKSTSDRLFIPKNVVPFVWIPKTYFYDIRGMRQFGSDSGMDTVKQIVFQRSNRTFTMSQRVELEITCGFNHSRFPFDHQTCYLRYGVINFNASQVKFTRAEVMDWTLVTDPTFMAQNTRSEFQTVIHTLGEQEFNFNTKFSYTGLRIELERNSGPYFWNFYIPLAMFVIVSWLSFLISIDQVPGRMGLLITLYLILVNTYSTTKETAPWLQTFGLLGIWMLGCQVIIFLPMLEYGFLLYMVKFHPRFSPSQSWSSKKDLRNTLAHVDWICLFVMPGVFASFVFCYWAHVHFSSSWSE